MKIAIDFDGTIVEHRYPEIGKEMLFAFETMRELQKQKHQLILWTYRSGRELEEAVEFCRERGIEFYAVNKSYPEEKLDESISRKIQADVFIDDRNVGGFPGWSNVWQMLNPPGGPEEELKSIRSVQKKGGLLRRLFGRGLFILVLALLCAACGNRVQPKSETPDPTSSRTVRVNGTKIGSPSPNQRFTCGESIPVGVEMITDTVPPIDSVEFYLDAVRQRTVYQPPYSYDQFTGGLSVGRKSIRISVYYADGRKEYHDTEITILSDIVPGYLSYRIVETHPHDIRAYTQGLVWEDGFLYEGTGNWGESSLRKNNINTGEPERIMNLAEDIFGEGITIFGDRIFQLTYKSQVGFVYDKESFQRIQKVYYETKEGWGLTHDGENLIMSDGSHRIYYMDPEYFTEIRNIEVYNDKHPVSRLNELEYINGKIFANIYGEEEIVIIDPSSGKETARLNMRGILPEADRHRGIDVFNGIAWNPEREILYVTGKYWPKLFAVSIEGEF